MIRQRRDLVEGTVFQYSRPFSFADRAYYVPVVNAGLHSAHPQMPTYQTPPRPSCPSAEDLDREVVILWHPGMQEDPNTAYIDKLPIEDCYNSYVDRIRLGDAGIAESGIPSPRYRGQLTLLQVAAAQKEWSRKVREGLKANRITEKNRIACQGDYLDD